MPRDPFPKLPRCTRAWWPSSWRSTYSAAEGSFPDAASLYQGLVSAVDVWYSAAKGSLPDNDSLYQGLVVAVEAEYSAAKYSFRDAALL